MKFKQKIALLMILAAIQIPCAVQAAEEDKDLALIAAEQERSSESEQLDEINPALTESISTEKSQETDKEIKERKKKLKQTRKEKEKTNERKLAESKKNSDTPRTNEPTIIIDPNEPPVEPEEPLIIAPKVEPATPKPPQQPQQQPPSPQPQQQPPTISESAVAPQANETVAIPDQKVIYNNFAEVARAVKFIPLYVPKKSGYEITALYSQPGVVEVRYGRRWEPTVSLAIRTHKRADGEELKDISGVTGVKWRVDTSTGTTIYIAKISETRQVAAWAVGHYTFSAQAENLSFAGFHSLVADELVELSTHYYLDL